MPGKSPPGRAEPTLTENAASPFQVNQHTSSSLFSSSISMFVSRVQSRGSKVVALKLSTAASEARTPFPLALGRAPPEDATRTQNSMFGIRNLRKPRELSQPDQLDMVGERGFEPPTPWSRTRCSTRLSHSPTTPTFSSIWPLARLGWSLSTPSVYHPAAGLPAGGTPAKPSVRAPLFVHKQCRTASALMLAHVAVRAQIAHSRTRLLRRQNLPHRESKG